MGPIQYAFVALFLVWGAIGLVRGYAKELGVTLMLLIGLFVLVIVDDKLCDQVMQVLEFIVGPDPQKQATLKAILYAGFLILITFIAYQGETFSYPEKGKHPVISLLVGWLNGYLFAGSLWYYLASANWPFMQVYPYYTPLYQAIYQILPPNLLSWPFLIALIVLMIILRVIR